MTRTTRLAMVLALNLALIAGLVLVGISAHSLGVLAAGGDYFADAAAIGASLLAIALSRQPPTERRPHGYPRATAIAAFTNGVLLLLVVAVVIVAAVQRLVSGAHEVQGLPIAIASGTAAVVMVLGALILHGDLDDEQDDEGDRANMRAVLLDTIADAAAAGGVALTGLVIAVTGTLYWLDPAVALLIAAVIAYHAVVLLRDVRRTLRRPTPISVP